MRAFGLTAGICAAILLNLPMLEWKTTLPITAWGTFGVVCVGWDLIRRRRSANR